MALSLVSNRIFSFWFRIHVFFDYESLFVQSISFTFEMCVSHNSHKLCLSLFNIFINHYIWDDFQHAPWLNSTLLVQVWRLICTPSIHTTTPWTYPTWVALCNNMLTSSDLDNILLSFKTLYILYFTKNIWD